MIEAGIYHTLKVVKAVDFGLYLDGDGEEILLPKRFVPKDANEGDEIEVFIYHDSDNRLIATTQKPYGIVGDIVSLEVVGKTRQGAFMDWGLMKDIFLPLSQQKSIIREGAKYLVYIYRDDQTGRVAASEHISRFINNDHLTVEPGEEVDITIWRKTDIGYAVIINGIHHGVLHYNEVFKELNPGDKERGYIKSIQEDNKINVSLGKQGYQRIGGEADKVWQLLVDNDGYLPYNDKSAPEDIYNYFGMSKKAFKMATGTLYKQRKIIFTTAGIKLNETDE